MITVKVKFDYSTLFFEDHEVNSWFFSKPGSQLLTYHSCLHALHPLLKIPINFCDVRLVCTIDLHNMKSNESVFTFLGFRIIKEGFTSGSYILRRPFKESPNSLRIRFFITLKLNFYLFFYTFYTLYISFSKCNISARKITF